MQWRCGRRGRGPTAHIGIAIYGALEHVPPPRLSTVQFFWSLQIRTNSDIGLYVAAYAEIILQAYSFVTIYCMNFVIFLSVTLKLFSLPFVPHLASNPGDATDCPP